jgi:3-isopropylmalate/(R)-2-methylmalate dehydratase small subunit
MEELMNGTVRKFPDNVNTDVIIPARYLNDASPENLKRHCMEDIDSSFASKVQEGDIIAGGFNFGSGSSREHAPLALKASGIGLVIAKSFARIFYRNCINIGLLAVEDEGFVNNASDGDLVEYDGEKVRNLSSGAVFNLPKRDDFIQSILDCGGLMSAVSKK